MPTANEFETAAQRLDDIARWVGGPLAAVGHANQHVCVGGHLTGLIQRTIDDATGHVGTVVGACGAAADEARARAAACRRYTEAMVSYRAALDRAEHQLALEPSMLGLLDWPERPIPPGPWAEEG